MAENGEETRLKTPKTAAKGWPKISNTARKYNKDEKSGKLRQKSSNVRVSTFWATIG